MIQKGISLYLFVGVILLSVMFANSFLRSKSSYAKALGILCLTLQVYLLGYLMEINSESLEAMMFWNQIQYVGIPFFPALWLVVSMLYTGRGVHMKGLIGLGIFALPIITFVLHLTNAWHHLVYSHIELRQSAGMKLMLLHKGPWYYIHSGYILILLILCSWFYYQRYRMSTDQEKLQFRLLLFASALPYLALILGVVNLGGFGLDYTALILPPCIFLLNTALTRYNFLDIKTFARERVFEDSTEGLILLNRFYRVVDFNKASDRLFRWFEIQLMQEAQLDRILSNQPDMLTSIKQFKETVFHTEVDGEARYVHISVSAMGGKEERGGLLITVADVTERELLKRRLMEMANSDELSGLNNRRHFRECAEEAYQYARRYHTDISVLMLDLDHFKRVNDTYGHLAGDAVIQEFSSILQASFRRTDIIGRMGGEEFAVVMVATNASEAYQKAEYVREAVETHATFFEGQEIGITVSIGIAGLQEETKSFDELMSKADHALYEAKRAGRNRTVIESQRVYVSG